MRLIRRVAIVACLSGLGVPALGHPPGAAPLGLAARCGAVVSALSPRDADAVAIEVVPAPARLAAGRAIGAAEGEPLRAFRRVERGEHLYCLSGVDRSGRPVAAYVTGGGEIRRVERELDPAFWADEIDFVAELLPAAPRTTRAASITGVRDLKPFIRYFGRTDEGLELALIDAVPIGIPTRCGPEAEADCPPPPLQKPGRPNNDRR